MTTPYENFVNIALGKALSSDVTLPTADKIPVFTGIGRQVTGKTKAELGLALTADLGTAASADVGDFDTAGSASTAQINAQSYADGLITSVYKVQGSYNPQTTGNFPTSANTVGSIPIKQAFIWIVSGVSGQYTFQGVTVNNGDTIVALIDNPSATTSADWHITESNLGYTPENQNNKATDFSVKNHIKFPSTQAVDENYVSLNSQTLSEPKKTQVKSNIGLSDADGLAEGSTNKYFTEARVVASILTGYVVAAVNAVVAATDSVSVAIGKLQKQITDLSGSFRYSVNPQTDTTYTVQGSDVNQYGNVIIKCTNGSAIAVTLPTPTTLGASVGDSFNIRQGGEGIVTIVGALEGNGVFTAQHETKTLIAQASNTWLVVGG
ncbi:hypothetical protein [uncultured Flavobacterium sp.]|uniref:hypothetical protein n=1 Tax=uncultured Flavobacterium sp. TaxID=165435 RepID=UPI00259A5E86|nr:hypothetical protein [uncultured Flavobacterium sp.]